MHGINMFSKPAGFLLISEHESNVYYNSRDFKKNIYNVFFLKKEKNTG